MGVIKCCLEKGSTKNNSQIQILLSIKFVKQEVDSILIKDLIESLNLKKLKIQRVIKPVKCLIHSKLSSSIYFVTNVSLFWKNLTEAS